MSEELLDKMCHDMVQAGLINYHEVGYWEKTPKGLRLESDMDHLVAGWSTQDWVEAIAQAVIAIYGVDTFRTLGAVKERE